MAHGAQPPPAPPSRGRGAPPGSSNSARTCFSLLDIIKLVKKKGKGGKKRKKKKGWTMVKPALDGSSDRESYIPGGKISETDRQIRGETDFIQKGGSPQDVLFQIEVMQVY